MSVVYCWSGALYQAERERQGLRREEIAVRLGCSYHLVQAVEIGTHPNPSASKAARFAAALGRRVDDFMVPVDEPVTS
jgi:transcriptional regulator with XRE-family HTH domain